MGLEDGLTPSEARRRCSRARFGDVDAQAYRGPVAKAGRSRVRASAPHATLPGASRVALPSGPGLPPAHKGVLWPRPGDLRTVLGVPLPPFSSRTGSRLSPSSQRKRARRRTVFSAQQLRVLEEFFEGKPYGTYEERETLAARLILQEDQVQVWLKNNRAKDRRLQRLRGQQGQRAHAAPQESLRPSACAPQPAHAPTPAPASASTLGRWPGSAHFMATAHACGVGLGWAVLLVVWAETIRPT
ncbi:PREDICTED: homeobox protein engrailed-1-B-like [Myotis davidii]|uniref:homeobox protein engrailed-1-B-like n=1 Tax=Myotis davidii TaxID=225400 RepID=UPI000766F5D2|nr:PREDICTED: homeobox protein engrailed-1-B-like [Myotis davidii]